MTDRRLHGTFPAGVLTAVLLVAGCGRQVPNYIPSVQSAQESVRLGLDAWVAGRAAGEVPGTNPAIYVTDTGRKPGQTLTSYEILGETRGSAGRTVAVLLHLQNPGEEVRTQYIVVGIDPLWVFRQADYELLMHWDHHMPAPVEPVATAPSGDGPASAVEATNANPAAQRSAGETSP